MKQLDSSTIGGRIRQVRKEMQQTMEEFAEPMGIAASYLGYLERGTRNPSRDILQRISEYAEVSIDWLKYGDPDPNEASSQEADTIYNKVAPDPVSAIDPQLFLSLVLQKAPSVTKDTLATVLAVPVETVDKILAGEATEYIPRWDMACSLLARRLDVTALRRDLYNLDAFLERAEYAAKIDALYSKVQQYVTDKYGEFIVCPGDADYYDPSAPRTGMVLRSKQPPTYDWCFRYLNRLAPMSEADTQGVIDAVSAFPGHVTIIVTSLEVFNSFTTYFDALQGRADALDSEGRGHTLELPNVSVFLYDEKTGDIDELMFDDDYTEE